MLNLSAIPQCAVACLVSSFSSTTCEPTDAACLCHDQGYNHVVESCVLGNCTVKEGLLAKNASWSGCGFPVQNRDENLIVALSMLTAIIVVMFVLRILAKAVRISPWGWDDSTIVLVFVVAFSYQIVGLVIVKKEMGLGRDIWTLTPDQIKTFLFVVFIFETIYFFLTFCVKISIIFLYMRIFPGRQTQIILWVTQAVLIASLVAFSVAGGFQCQPASHFWKFWTGEDEGSCFDLAAFALTNAWYNLALEIWMLALPASHVYKLNMSLKKRLQVLAMFGFGIFTVIISIVRLPTVRSFSTTVNPTSDFYWVTLWSAVEICAGLVVACMPAARLFVVRYAPRMLPSNRRSHKRPDDTTTSTTLRGPSNEKHRTWTPSSTFAKNAVPWAGDASHLSASSSSSKKKKPRPLSKSFSMQSLVPLSPRDLDKNRRYSMQVTVTSSGPLRDSTDSRAANGGSSLSSSSGGGGGGGGDWGQEEEAMMRPDRMTSLRFPTPPRTPRTPRTPQLNVPGSYLDVPARLLAEERAARAREGIVITQDVKVERSEDVLLPLWSYEIGENAGGKRS